MLTKALLKRCVKMCRDVYHHPHFENGPVSGCLEVENGIQYVAFAGSENLFNWLSNFYFLKVARGWFKGKAHKGFINNFEGIRSHAMERLDKTLPVIVTGHSAGGFTAVLFARWLKYLGYDVKACITFGKPRGGNKDFRDDYNSQGIYTLRVVLERDGCVTVPSIGFYHEGQSFVICAKSGTQTSYALTRAKMDFIKDPFGYGLDHLIECYFRVIYVLTIKEITDGVEGDSDTVETST